MARPKRDRGHLRCGAAIAAVLVAFLMAASAAAARSVVIALPRGFAPMGAAPSTLAGPDVVYSHPWETNNHIDLWIVPPAGPEQVLARYTNGVEFTGSSSLLVIVQGTLGSSGRRGADLLAGPPESPLGVVSHCAGPSLGTPSASGRVVSADGDDVAYLDDGCEGTERLAVQQLGSSAAPAIFAVPDGYQIDDLSLAGAYVAYHLEPSSGGGGEIIEANWRTGLQTVRVADGASGPCGSQGPAFQDVYDFCAVALQDDGKLARLLGRYSFFPGSPPAHGQDRGEPASNLDTCEGTIDWLSPADPAWHRVVSNTCVDGVSWLRGDQKASWMAGDRVLYSPPAGLQSIAVSDLQGRGSGLGDAQMVYGFDGQHVLVDDATCTTFAIYSQSVVGDPPLPFVYGSRCPFRFSHPALYLGRHPRFVVTVRCPNGCRGPIEIGNWNYTDTQTGDFTITTGGRRRITIPLSPRGPIARTARRRGKVTVVIDTWDVTSFNPHESTAEQASFIPSRSATARFTLRPRR